MVIPLYPSHHPAGMRGIGGRHAVEYPAGFPRNQWPTSRGIRSTQKRRCRLDRDSVRIL